VNQNLRRRETFETILTILKGKFPNDLTDLQWDAMPGEYSSQTTGHFLFVDRIHRRLLLVTYLLNLIKRRRCGIALEKNQRLISVCEFQMKWKKILWQEQPDFADNHVDKSFLDGLEKNTNISDFEYPSLVFASGAITQQFSSIFTFCNLFIRIYYHKLEINLRIVAILVVISYLVWRQVKCIL
jgi:hypothetical protein